MRVNRTMKRSSRPQPCLLFAGAMLSQQNISATTLTSATLVAGGGATLRVWAPSSGGLPERHFAETAYEWKQKTVF